MERAARFQQPHRRLASDRRRSPLSKATNPPIGSVALRRFVLQDSARVREQLIALSDRERCLTYCILEADLALERYVATVRLDPVTDGRRTFWHWQSTFRTPRGRERELAELVGRDVYEGGFAGLARHFGRGSGARAGPPASGPGADSDCRRVPGRGGARGAVGSNCLVPSPGAGRSASRPKGDRRWMSISAGDWYRSPRRASRSVSKQRAWYSTSGPRSAGSSPATALPMPCCRPEAMRHTATCLRVSWCASLPTSTTTNGRGSAQRADGRVSPASSASAAPEGDGSGARGRWRTGKHRGAMGARASAPSSSVPCLRKTKPGKRAGTVVTT